MLRATLNCFMLMHISAPLLRLLAASPIVQAVASGRLIFTRYGSLLARPLLVLGLCGIAGRAEPGGWLKIDAGDFIVYSDASEDAAVKVTLRYAAYRLAFRELLLAPGRELPPSVLILFRRESDFLAHCPTDPSRGNFRIFNHSIEVDGTSVNAFSLAAGAERAMETTLEFETMWMLRRLGYPTPLWMSQGVGKVLSTTAERKGRWMVGWRRETSGRYSWEKLFLVGPHSDIYRSSSNADYHNQIWGLMDWVLFKDAQSRPRFLKLAHGLRTKDPDALLPEIMEISLDEFKGAISRHGRTRQPHEVSFDEASFLAQLSITPAPPAEILVRQADLLLAAGRKDAALANLDTALTQSPELVAVQEAWGRRSLHESRLDEALAHYRKALAGGSRNYVGHLLSGIAHLKEAESRALSTPRRVGEGGRSAELAVADLRAAVKLDPENDEAHRQFARALYYAPKVATEEAELLRARLETGVRDVALRLEAARVLARLDRTAGEGMLQEIINDPQLPRWSEEHARHHLREIAGWEP